MTIVQPADAHERPSDVRDLLLQLEAERCKAMVAGDKVCLRQLLHKDLMHVHAKRAGGQF